MPPKKKDADDGKYKLELRFGRTKANLKMGVVGLPNVGKSSFFNLMTKQNADAANYPFCTIKENEARCQVPDVRYDTLCKMWKPASEVPAWLNLVDIAGLIRGASEGEGLGNAFLSTIQAVDGIFHMVRLFEDDDIIHVDDCVDPVRDLDTITQELCLKDLAYLDSIVDDVEKKAKRANKKIPEVFTNTSGKVRQLLEERKVLSKCTWTSAEVEQINEHFPRLIMTKPMCYLLNMNEKGYLQKKNKWLKKVHDWIQEHGGGTIIPLSIEFEQRIWEARDDPDALKAIEEEGPNAKSAIEKVVKTGYHELNLIHFFTCGEDEVRAWTVYKGATAPQAAGCIHNDLEKCFIKAETCSYEDFAKHTVVDGSHAKCNFNGVKAAGKHRIEGKAYVVEDGDILHIMHNAKK